MKKLTRERVVPIISAKVSCVMEEAERFFGLAEFGHRRRILASRFSLELKADRPDRPGSHAAGEQELQVQIGEECSSCITRIISSAHLERRTSIRAVPWPCASRRRWLATPLQ